MPLDTLENVKLALQVTGEDDDTLLEALQTAADSFIETYCSRSFLGGSFSEDHPGGSRYVFLKNFPLDAVASVNVDANRTFTGATVLDSTQYVIHADRGVIESLNGPFLGDRNGNSFPAAIRVSYSTPEDTVPGALKRAYADLIGHWFRQAKTYTATEQQNLLQKTDGTEVTEYPWSQSGGYRLPQSVKQVLDLYRMPQ
jgi:uncharacterized phiE125 gp8 family phage protein